MDLNSHVVVVEIPGGDTAHAKLYTGPLVLSDNASSAPVTGEFKDVNQDSKPDMLVHVGDQTIIYLNDGTQFKAQ